MKKHSLDNIALEMGHCCDAWFLKVEEIKAKARGWPAISPAFLMKKTGVHYRTAVKIKKRWQAGEIQCKCRANCLKDKLEGRDVDSVIDPSVKAFQALRGQSVTLYRLAVGKYELVRETPETAALVTEVSRVPWLWIKVILQAERVVYLGDQLWVENIAWGTVIDIDDRSLYLLLPGERHKSKRKG